MMKSDLIRQLLDLVPDVVFLMDAEGRYRYANHTALEHLGRPLEEVVGRTNAELFPAAAASTVRKHLEEALGSEQTRRYTYPLEMPSGETREWEVDLVPVSEEQLGFPGVAGIARDITRLRETRRELREERATLREIIEHIEEVIWCSTADKDEMLYLNSAIEEVWGRNRERMYEEPRSWLEAILPEDRPRVEAALPEQAEGTYDEEYRILHPDGQLRWIQDRAYPIRDEDGEVIRVVGIARDITERKKFEDALQYQVLHDQLTGLPNRTLFQDRLVHALERAERTGEQVAVLFLDLDGFKIVNDSRGHAAGDQVLRMVADRLQETLREGDTVARIGGDEFVLMLEGISSRADVERAISRVRGCFEAPFELEDASFSITSSIGVAHSGLDFEGPDELIRLADAAMYRAKRSDGTDVHVLDA